MTLAGNTFPQLKKSFCSLLKCHKEPFSFLSPRQPAEGGGDFSHMITLVLKAHFYYDAARTDTAPSAGQVEYYISLVACANTSYWLEKPHKLASLHEHCMVQANRGRQRAKSMKEESRSCYRRRNYLLPGSHIIPHQASWGRCVVPGYLLEVTASF